MSQLAQVRLPKQDIDYIDRLVKDGEYISRSEVIRDALRKHALERLLSVRIPNTGDSVKEVRAIRKKMGKLTREDLKNL
jgi:Arc/MetJ-type ribon-helix-helix transcriptional regulator